MNSMPRMPKGKRLWSLSGISDKSNSCTTPAIVGVIGTQLGGPGMLQLMRVLVLGGTLPAIQGMILSR